MELPSPLAVLARAESVELGRVGAAAHATDGYLAYCEARANASRWLPELTWMLSHATPAGRMYAAYLIGSFDAEAARGAWASLENERAMVSLGQGGCMIESAPLGDFARRAGRQEWLSGTPGAPSPPGPLAPPGGPALPRQERRIFDRALGVWNNHRALIVSLLWLFAASAYVWLTRP